MNEHRSTSFHDSMISVSLQNKLGDAADAAHSPEDEGIFVGRKPIVPRKVVYRAEKRIIDESEIDKKVCPIRLITMKTSVLIVR